MLLYDCYSLCQIQTAGHSGGGGRGLADPGCTELSVHTQEGHRPPGKLCTLRKDALCGSLFPEQRTLAHAVLTSCSGGLGWPETLSLCRGATHVGWEWHQVTLRLVASSVAHTCALPFVCDKGTSPGGTFTEPFTSLRRIPDGSVGRRRG